MNNADKFESCRSGTSSLRVLCQYVKAMLATEGDGEGKGRMAMIDRLAWKLLLVIV